MLHSIRKTLKSVFNISILLSAIFVAPLFVALQFLPNLQGFVNGIAGHYLPHPTVNATEKKMRRRAEKNAREMNRKSRQLDGRNHKLTKSYTSLSKKNNDQSRAIDDLNRRNRTLTSDKSRLTEKNRTLQNQKKFIIKDLSNKQAKAIRKVNLVGNRGWKIIRRGTTALGVGWIPYAGGAYDLYSLQEDYKDVCDLLRTIDELSGFLLVDSHLYKQNYCNKRDEAVNRLRVN